MPSTNIITIHFQARLKVPEALIQEIASLNSLDVELYKYGQEIFKKQQAMMQSMVETVC